MYRDQLGEVQELDHRALVAESGFGRYRRRKRPHPRTLPRYARVCTCLAYQQICRKYSTPEEPEVGLRILHRSPCRFPKQFPIEPLKQIRFLSVLMPRAMGELQSIPANTTFV